MFGFLNIYKPKGMTSHDVVSYLRRILKIKQIGHSGTLDPLAEGVLPIAIGKATRLFEYFSDDKAYIVEMKFGQISDTYDSEGVIEEFSDKKVTEDELLKVIPNFVGNITQIPPAHSAVHYKGKRLYELARKGIIPDDIPKREVNVEKIDLLDFDFDKQTARLEIFCSKGTYIRSIVNDIGMALESGAYMYDLLRSISSNFTLKDSFKLDEIQSVEDAKKMLINPVEVLLYKQKQLSDEDFCRVKNGNYIQNDDYQDSENLFLVYDNQTVALASVEDNLIKVKKVFL